MNSNNYIEINLSCWKRSPGVLVRTALGPTALLRIDIIPGSPCNMSTYYRVTLAIQGRVVCVDKTEE